MSQYVLLKKCPTPVALHGGITKKRN